MYVLGASDKKNETKTELPVKLEMLLSVALKNGEVSEKEFAVLRAEAQKHDINEAELDMIIDSFTQEQENVD